MIDTTQHTNLVTISFAGGWTGGFEWDGGYAISSGQPWSGVTSTPTGDTVTIQILAGRHGTSQVAQWFRQRASAAVVSSDFFADWPADLNFAFTGTLEVNGDTWPVVIGQGSDIFQNNWWIGGPGWSPGGSGECAGVYTNTNPDGTRVFIPQLQYPFGVYEGPC